MSRITISDISVEQITEVSETDAAAVVGGKFSADILSLAGNLLTFASLQVRTIDGLARFAITEIGKL
ncbi:MAG: hypothetical protein N2235_02745 [Fischerella sp.]|nr:hypothetical protein [Fischerella sp.]